MKLTRSKFIAGLIAVLLFPIRATAQGVAACTARLDMFGPLCQPKPPVKAKVRPMTTITRSYSMVYNVEGDWHPSDSKIARHLIQVHGINAAGMSRSQMLMAHDKAHGVRFSADPPPVVRTQVIVPYSSSRCPGGVCPTAPSGRRMR